MQQTITKGVPDSAWLGGKGDPLGIVQDIKIWTYCQLVYALTRIGPKEWDAEFFGILIYKRTT